MPKGGLLIKKNIHVLQICNTPLVNALNRNMGRLAEPEHGPELPMSLGSGTAMRDLCMPRNRGQLCHVHDPEHAMCQIVFRNSVALELRNAG